MTYQYSQHIKSGGLSTHNTKRTIHDYIGSGIYAKLAKSKGGYPPTILHFIIPLGISYNAVLPAGLSKTKHEKKMPLSEKKNTIFSNKKKKALFDIISFLKRVFCLPFLHKICPFNMFKTINYFFLFFNISKTYFTKQQNTFNDHSFT